jgi:hypothetical protein
MKRLLFPCILGAVFSMTGCAVPSGSVAKIVTPTESSPRVSLPAWVLNPDKQGYLSVIGSAPKQDLGGRDAQFRVALTKAHQELAQMVRLQVQSSSSFKSETHNGAVVAQDADIETKLQTSVGLRLDAARVIEEWTHPQTGELYLWLVTPN